MRIYNGKRQHSGDTVVYVWKQLRQLDTCSYTVKSVVNCGRFSFISEAFNWQCLARLFDILSSWNEAGIGAKNISYWRTPFQHAFGGPFGEQGMLEALRIEADPYK